VIDLINGHFVPVYLRNQDFSETGPAPADEKAERNRIYHEALKGGLSAGSVCVYLLSPDARPIAVAPLNQQVATDPDRLAELIQQVVEQLQLKKGDPVVTPAPPCHPPCDADSLVLRLTARYLERRGNDLVRLNNASVLGTQKGGNWGDLPSQDWIILSRSEWMKLLPPAGADAQAGTSYEPDREVMSSILRHFFPPTENTAFEKNRIENMSIQSRVESTSKDAVRTRIEGRFRMKHPFYHKDDDNFVEATIVGMMEFDRRAQRIASFRLVTDDATYGSSAARPQVFGIAVRSVP
jgi:hypothetical protein